MTRRWQPFRDTIARRFAVTIVLTVVLAVVLGEGVAWVAGVWALPSAQEMGLQDRAKDIVQMIEAASPADRLRLADAIVAPTFRVDWYPERSTIAVALDAAGQTDTNLRPSFIHTGGPRRTVLFEAGDGNLPPQMALGRSIVASDQSRDSYFLSVELNDQSWVVFTASARFWGANPVVRYGTMFSLLLFSIIGMSAFATYQLARPISIFTRAVRRFGSDPHASPVPEVGPLELRLSIRAFNSMQAQIQLFVEDRTTMLAVVSHDLRTPLTKMRLRGEFIEDPEQRARLFRDVDDMQAMVESALAFFRDDVSGEDQTAFDVPGLLQTIVDEWIDVGQDVSYLGPLHLRFVGRPFALKRAFTNLIDNAVKYGGQARIVLRVEGETVLVEVHDTGPGIPAEAAERVFSPFYRLEGSRSRSTGGVGLGLTSARAVIRAHGGDIRLRNRLSGGLEVIITLPFNDMISADQ